MQFLIMPSLIFELKKPQVSKTAANSNFNLGTETDTLQDRGEPLRTFIQPYILAVELCFSPSGNTLI